jgi:hypothetical protein
LFGLVLDFFVFSWDLSEVAVPSFAFLFGLEAVVGVLKSITFAVSEKPLSAAPKAYTPWSGVAVDLADYGVPRVDVVAPTVSLLRHVIYAFQMVQTDDFEFNPNGWTNFGTIWFFVL